MEAIEEVSKLRVIQSIAGKVVFHALHDDLLTTIVGHLLYETGTLLITNRIKHIGGIFRMANVYLDGVSCLL